MLNIRRLLFMKKYLTIEPELELNLDNLDKRSDYCKFAIKRLSKKQIAVLKKVTEKLDEKFISYHFSFADFDDTSAKLTEFDGFIFKHFIYICLENPYFVAENNYYDRRRNHFLRVIIRKLNKINFNVVFLKK